MIAQIGGGIYSLGVIWRVQVVCVFAAVAFVEQGEDDPENSAPGFCRWIEINNAIYSIPNLNFISLD